MDTNSNMYKYRNVLSVSCLTITFITIWSRFNVERPANLLTFVDLAVARAPALNVLINERLNLGQVIGIVKHSRKGFPATT